MNINSLLVDPTIQYCEKPINWIIRRPNYALSNLWFFGVGIFILIQGKGSVLSKLFGIIAIIVALCSFSYDATYTYLAQMTDLSGMLLFLNLILFLNIKTLSIFKSNILQIAVQFLMTILTLSFAVFVKGYIGNILFGLISVIYIFSELFLIYKKRHIINKIWIIAFSAFVIGSVCWYFDISKLYCDPTNLINGRTLFHMFTSISIYCLYRFYADQNKLEQII
jgi:hypothetical protein